MSESYDFNKPWRLKDKLYYPIAWYKFMKYSITDYKNGMYD